VDKRVIPFESIPYTRLTLSQATQIWNKNFDFPQDVKEKAAKFIHQYFDGHQRILGVHFRGTDKQDDIVLTNPTPVSLYLRVIQEYLQTHQVDKIFIASDCQYFVDQIQKIHSKTCTQSHLRSTSGTALWKNHEIYNNVALGKEALLDCLILSKCHTVIQGQSALSSFATVLNPNQESLRISACLPNWHLYNYPTLCTSKHLITRLWLRWVQLGDCTHSRLEARVRKSIYLLKTLVTAPFYYLLFKLKPSTSLKQKLRYQHLFLSSLLTKS
jgi:hypothetical protein